MFWVKCFTQLFRLRNGILKVAGGVPVITLFFLIAVRPLLSFSVRLETCEPPSSSKNGADSTGTYLPQAGKVSVWSTETIRRRSLI